MFRNESFLDSLQEDEFAAVDAAATAALSPLPEGEKPMSSIAGAAVAPAAVAVDDDADSEYDAAWMCGAAWTQVLQDAELTGTWI